MVRWSGTRRRAGGKRGGEDIETDDGVNPPVRLSELTMSHVGNPRQVEGYRVLRWLSFFNNILMIPMFTVMVLEVGFTQVRFDIYQAENLFFCICFQLEYWLGLALSQHRRAYLRDLGNLMDFVSAIPFGYVFQSLRFVRLFRLLRVARLVWRVRRFTGRGAKLVRAFGLVSVLVVTGALALRIVEPSATDSFQESLWWAIVTLSTVGYGDVLVTTGPGRVVAAAIIVCGIGVFGYMAGFMTTLVEHPEDDEVLLAVRELQQQVASLTSEVQELRKRP